jgi:hypothetical protein
MDENETEKAMKVQTKKRCFSCYKAKSKWKKQRQTQKEKFH